MMCVNLQDSWWIRDVEIPTRVVLAPMAGVSVQAFRRQGRRYGAGLVCSEMVSCAGIEHRNEKTLGYLRVASDEHPLAIQIFGSEPRAMAEAARERPGSMAAILGLADEVVESLCRKIVGVWPANYNCPGQLVVSGEHTAVD